MQFALTYPRPCAAGRRRLNAARSGITLLELLVVIVIMAIVMSVSIPAFTSMGRGAGMRGAVAEVRSTLSLSRQWAITKREPVTFQCGQDNSTNYYVVYTYDAITKSNTIIQATNYLEKGLCFHTTLASNSLTFKTSGDLEGGSGLINIGITNAQTVKKTIVVNRLTGGISVEN